jgi:amino acid adenylation domain-containing protein
MFDSNLVHEWLSATARTMPDKSAIVCMDEAVSYRQLDQQSDALADTLLKMGLKPQDRVIIFLDNCIETVVSLYGILKAGGVFIILNTSLKADKLAYILDNAEAAMLISHTSKARIVLEAIPKAQTKPKAIWVCPSPTLPPAITTAIPSLHWNDILQNPPARQPRPTPADSDLAALIYTSGSTGEPKAVMQPHDKMVAVSKSIISYLQSNSDDVVLNVLSLSFGYGLYQMLMSAMFGGTVVLEKSFVYLHDVLTKIERCKVTGFPLVPTVAAMLLNLNNLSAYNFSSLRYITSAGAALPPEHTRRMRSLWPHVNIIPMHGLTECVRTCYLPPEQIDVRPDSVGVPIPGCQLSIVDEQGNELTNGQAGELVVSGVNVMPGYWKDPELTARVFRKNNISGQVQLYSGDLFRRDSEGFLYFVARKDDMIKTRGERVSPKEIENVLLRIDGVVETAVIGIPDPILGQVPKAFIVKKTDANLTEADILLFASQNMENFMVPKVVQFLPELPKTQNGKIDKKTLKQQEKTQ